MSQSTIKMDKGYYGIRCNMRHYDGELDVISDVAIHNKNGQGLLRDPDVPADVLPSMSQSTIKMDKGYYGILVKNSNLFINDSRNPQ